MTFIDNISNIRDKYNQQTKHHLHKKNIVSGRGHRSNTITVRYYVSNYRATTGSVGGLSTSSKPSVNCSKMYEWLGYHPMLHKAGAGKNNRLQHTSEQAVQYLKCVRMHNAHQIKQIKQIKQIPPCSIIFFLFRRLRI